VYTYQVVLLLEYFYTIGASYRYQWYGIATLVWHIDSARVGTLVLSIWPYHGIAKPFGTSVPLIGTRVR
jgi:hypothetical protein